FAISGDRTDSVLEAACRSMAECAGFGITERDTAEAVLTVALVRTDIGALYSSPGVGIRSALTGATLDGTVIMNMKGHGKIEVPVRIHKSPESMLVVFSSDPPPSSTRPTNGSRSEYSEIVKEFAQVLLATFTAQRSQAQSVSLYRALVWSTQEDVPAQMRE